jgi:hypothetical protein
LLARVGGAPVAALRKRRQQRKSWREHRGAEIERIRKSGAAARPRGVPPGRSFRLRAPTDGVMPAVTGFRRPVHARGGRRGPCPCACPRPSACPRCNGCRRCTGLREGAHRSRGQRGKRQSARPKRAVAGKGHSAKPLETSGPPKGVPCRIRFGAETAGGGRRTAYRQCGTCIPGAGFRPSRYSCNLDGRRIVFSVR